MDLEIVKASGRSLCRGLSCKKDALMVDLKGRILKNSFCLKIRIRGANGVATAYYCKACMDDLYIHCKSVLDPKLRILQ